MTPRDDVAIVAEKLIARVAAKDSVGLGLLFAPDVTWWTTPIPSPPWPTEIRSGRQVEAFALGCLSVFDITAITMRRVAVDADDAVLLGRLHGRALTNVADFSCDFVVWLTVQGGLITGLRLFLDTLAITSALRAGH
ncbi:SnoaL-like domain-containing protein [Lentzea sp. NEAU-D13]|uniref:SnoaL-like domain-containing protein n=1 Tax=Lentzea alba TaxID=2714351 RepID=A0A7C9VUA2_9PSEU|nr:nuclear transport factor 2 family protein [Lentzea alba]NGY63092.1 SnoaL-like domain-containing protein [Lentzea alba]